MNNWKVILATMVIFGAGVVTGGLLVRQSDRLTRPAGRAQPGLRQGPFLPIPGTVGLLRLEFLRRAQRELELTPEQRERIDRILKASQDRTRTLMEPVTPELRDELHRAKEEFRGVLDEQQRVRFDELLRQQQRPRDSKSVPRR